MVWALQVIFYYIAMNPILTPDATCDKALGSDFSEHSLIGNADHCGNFGSGVSEAFHVEEKGMRDQFAK